MSGYVDSAIGVPIAFSLLDTATVGEQHFPFNTCRDLHIEPLVVRDKQIKKTREYSDIVLTLHQTGNTMSGWSGGKLSFFMGTDNNRAAQLGISLDIENHCTLRLFFNQTLILYKEPESGKPVKYCSLLPLLFLGC
ncbi:MULTISPECIES: hypothetical protein [Xenorhabdus]|uniref:Type VI secretion protein n=1 Tax=Xenorhabdus ehlersii TaxID=290111 RepID=A0A2D0INT7_9GAMM|nr:MULTISPECIES: hypothetical protein [Xenorhabdus]MBC8951250.1 type VI secretion protein [Xenorhabdus sp. TS4]PHM23455.1 type VI secretion protein [Xenorhabdus ehlersii]